MQHGPTSTRPVQVSLTVETEEGLAVERRPQAQRLGSWCTVCIPTVGTGLVTQTKKKELVSEQRPQAQRLGSWCTVASLQLANVSSRRRRKGSPRIDAQKPNALDPGVQSHPSSWHVSHHADRGRACLVSTPTHTKKWKFGSRCCHTHWFSDFAFRAQLKGQDYVDPCELTHVATFTSRSTHAHVRLFLLCGRSTWVYCRQLYILDKHCTVRSHGFNLAHCLSRLARNPRFQGAVSWASLCPAGIAHSD